MPLLVQSSCTILYLEAESAYMQNMQGPSENNCGGASNLRNIIMEKQGGYAKLDKESVMQGPLYYLVYLSFLFYLFIYFC